MWEYIHTDELYHYGVVGMRWGVRKEARNKMRAAKARYKKALSTAKDGQAISTARYKYKNERAKIKFDRNRKIADLDAAESGFVKAGKKAAKVALLGIGSTAISSAMMFALSNPTRKMEILDDVNDLLNKLGVTYLS